MKFATRLKLILGIITISIICAGLFVYLDYSMSRASSVEAQLQSDSYTVGIDYSGVLTKEYVDEGSFVKTNDPLFELRSQTLSDAIRNNDVAKASLLYSLTDNGRVLISAAAPGQVQTISFREGAFVPANSQIAEINSEDKLYISATYRLSPPDYARLNKNSKVKIVFPDNTVVDGAVYDISLDTIDKQILTTIRARFDRARVNTNTFSVGSPVETSLYLDNKTWYNKLMVSVMTAFNPKSDK